MRVESGGIDPSFPPYLSTFNFQLSINMRGLVIKNTGSWYTCLLYTSQLGAEGYAVSAVGNDVFGTEIVQELDKNGICHLLGTVEYPTGSVMVELKDGIPTYTIIEGVAWDHIPLTMSLIHI